MKKTVLIVSTFTAALLAGCALNEERMNDEARVGSAVGQAERDIAAVEDADASYVTEITFNKGSTTLSSMDKMRLASLVEKARDMGAIEDIKVVTWADMEYPSPNTRKLSKAQRDLAKRRNRALRNYLRSVTQNVDVDAYNMAERPNAFERLLRTDDARIKRSLEVAGIPTTDSYIKIPSKASKSIVMLVME